MVLFSFGGYEVLRFAQVIKLLIDDFAWQICCAKDLLYKLITPGARRP